MNGLKQRSLLTGFGVLIAVLIIVALAGVGGAGMGFAVLGLMVAIPGLLAAGLWRRWRQSHASQA